jgi:hypothetical protein
MDVPKGNARKWKQWPVWVAGFYGALAMILVYGIETSELSERAVGSWVLKMSYWPVSEVWEAVVFRICRFEVLDGLQMLMWEAGSVILGTLWYFCLARAIQHLIHRQRKKS